MTLPLATKDIRGQMILLGTGTSVGVPTIGCGCDVCQSKHPRNYRTRCAAILGLPAGNLLIDTPPDLRTQLIREGIGLVHAVLYTHEHTDHLMGLDDVRIFPFRLNAPVPLYCEAPVERRIRTAFDYAFSELPPTHAGAVPQVEFRRITTAPLEILGSVVTPIRFLHGPRFQVLGFRFGRIAYCTDVSAIPDESWVWLQDLDVLILDALRPRPHVTHLSLDEAIAVAEKVRPRQTYFTHISHELDHETTNASLPRGMELAYDGLAFPLT